ncbi:MAG TPA: T9SS type A sorting domain-containing protein, partial [Bacteroidia bacterium]
YFGGNNVDYIDEIWRTSNSEMVVCGSSISTNVMATTNAWQPNNSSPNNYDAYFARFSSSGTLLLGSFYGGSLQDNGHGLAINSTGQLYITGETYSSDSIASQGAFMTTYTSGGDAFLGKFCLSPEPLISPSGINTICDSTSLTLVASPGYNSYSWNNSTFNDSLIIPANSASGAYYYTITVTDAFGCTGTSDTTTVNIDICNAVIPDENNWSLNVYPVPAHDQLQVLFQGNENEEKQVELYSAEGKLIFTAFATGDRYNIDLKKFAGGIYFLQVKCREGVITRKIIKE